MLSPTLQSYVDAVRDAVATRGETPGTDELRVLTSRLGVSARELADAEEPANSALSRGELALRSGRTDVALTEFAVAYALRPWDPTTTAGLSRALLDRARETRNTEDALRAKTWAIRTLDTEPNNAAARTTQEQLVELERSLSAPRPPVHVKPASLAPTMPPAAVEPAAPSSNAGVAIAIAVFAALVLVGAGVAAFLYLNPRAGDGGNAESQPTAVAPSPGSSADDADGGTAAPGQPPTPSAAGTPASGQAGQTATTTAGGPHINVPVQLRMPPQRGLDAVALDAVSSQLRVYEGQDYYVIAAVLVNGSGQEVREAQALLRLDDANGQTGATQRLHLLADHEAALRPEDRHGFGITVAAPDTVRSATIEVESVDAGPAPAANPPDLLDASWVAVPPTGMMAGIYERSRQYTPALGGTGGFQRLEMLVRNSGSVPITWMKLAITFVDERGNAVGDVDTIPVATTDPALAPGEARPFRVMTQLPDGWRNYTVRVIEAR